MSTRLHNKGKSLKPAPRFKAEQHPRGHVPMTHPRRTHRFYGRGGGLRAGRGRRY